MSKIVRYYSEDHNPDRGFFPGVPLDDITEERWNELPEWVQASVDASEMYTKTKRRPAEAAPRRKRIERDDDVTAADVPSEE